MKPKKIVKDILVVIIAFAFFAIWYENYVKEKAAPTSVSMNQNYKIYLITMDKVNEYWYYIDQGAAEMAALLGVNYIWDAPQKRDIQTQIDILNNAVNNGANAILISVIDSEKLSEPIKNAKEKGVKIVYVDSPSKEAAITTYATDNYDAGRVAAQTMIEELELLGIRDGKIGIVGINLTTDNTVNRENGFREVVAKDGRFTLLNTEYANSELVLANQAAVRLINENENLVGMFGTDEISSEGVGNAIKANNNKVVGIGFDKSELLLELMAEESLKALIIQNPFTMGYLGMAEAVAALQEKQTGPAYMNTGVAVLRKR
jgi:ribose transport system substrate-binding protein